ncbi:uncharacterized protein CTRU02_210877 [Colletotrichum truncatum]|uniref:Uncharacterized protein n=1 Tax=Colletotrichum truncatum TaxID=5467 RepID=A0ACC3YQ80_COLTU|nr:uncharacterized protein CTRU02_03637 [Colletotrichum truncatum]KAF6796659.1 hypothetical protein CTRU02_03637 [Colletotrichum truncatum]
MEPPFDLEHQLCSCEASPPRTSPASMRHLPGWPNIPPDKQDKPQRALDILEKEFCSNDLDRMASKLWWMSKQDSSNISPLHRQSVKRRSIIVTEDPKLHLVWIHDRIFVKPLPRYITSYSFWREHLCCDKAGEVGRRRERVRKAALGYLRTYAYLVQYESDFRICKDPNLQLIPADVTWDQFCDFTADVANINDIDVSARYTFGEIRLTRLNFYAPFFLRKSYFQRVEYQYGTYFARFYAPTLFVIGVASVVLSGFQVAVAVDDSNQESPGSALSAVALWFSILAIILFCGLCFCLGAILAYKLVKEWKYAIRDRLRLLEEGRKPE